MEVFISSHPRPRSMCFIIPYFYYLLVSSSTINLSYVVLLQESEWLRVTLHKWLDDEYCPEAANAEISKVAARSYYESLMEQQSDLGEILLKMAKDLEMVSFQESFHGAFSSANAAIHLVTLRMNSMAGR